MPAVMKPVKAFALVLVVLIAAVVGVAAFSAVTRHGVVEASPLFAQAQQVPSTADPPPSAAFVPAVQRARELVRTAVTRQDLPGVSVAVGAGGTLVWAEGFGWRDVRTRTPVTPRTRFNIGTAAAAVIAAAGTTAPSGTSTDPAFAWSPEAIGEPGEDFPPLAALRHNVLQPVGLAPAEYPIPGDRATFYVPKAGSDPRTGRRLMYMRDLACCASGKAFAATPSVLVRIALASKPASIDGDLAGGRVMSLLTRDGLAVVVTSNISHADTSGLAQRIANAFSEPAR